MAGRRERLSGNRNCLLNKRTAPVPTTRPALPNIRDSCFEFGSIADGAARSCSLEAFDTAGGAAVGSVAAAAIVVCAEAWGHGDDGGKGSPASLMSSISSPPLSTPCKGISGASRCWCWCWCWCCCWCCCCF